MSCKLNQRRFLGWFWIRCIMLSFLAVGLSACQANQAGFSDSSAASRAATDSADGTVPGTPDGKKHLGDGAVSSCSLQSVSVPVKILFIVDTSGSNVRATKNHGVSLCEPAFETCVAPTDPFKSFRSQSIGKFFDLYKSRSSFSWSFTTFSNNSSVPYMIEQGRPVFSDGTAMQDALDRFTQAGDAGDTPYLSGLASAYDAISADPGRTQSGSAAPLYYIIFLSDGYPTDALLGDRVDSARLSSEITSIVALAPGRVSLSAVYYSTNFDPVAASTMTAMAATGGGQFINANTATTASININDLIVIAQRNCH